MEKEQLYILAYKFYKRECTLEEKELIKQWLSINAANKITFQKLIKTLETSNIHFDGWTPDVEEALSKVMLAVDKKTPVFRINFYSWIKVAAIFILLLGIASVLSGILNIPITIGKSSYIETVCEYGEKAQVILPDGTKVWLNSGSTLKYPTNFNGHNRKVDLTGEAYFDVTKSKKAKFKVNTAEIDIVVMGTQFSVSAYPDDNKIKAYLFEGKVAVYRNDIKETLEPGDQVVFDKDKNQLSIERDLKRLPSTWKDGKLIIRSESLLKLTKILSRRFDVNFIFEDEECKNYVYSGTIENEMLTEILKAVSMASTITYTIEGKNIVLKSKTKAME